MLSKYRLLYHSIINTRPSQLYHRLRLQIKRRLLSNLASESYAAKTALSAELNNSLASHPPPALFEPRKQFVRKSKSNDLEVGFLNVWRPLQNPMNWHPFEMKKGTRLWLLNLHYMEFIEGIDSEYWFGCIKDWIDANRPYNKGYWLDDWNSYSLSIRVVVWMQQFERRGSSLSDTDKAIFLRSLEAQVRFLKSNLEVDIGGNHLVKNIKALLWASQFFDGPEARRWGKLGSQLLRKALIEQVTSDGVHFELSPAYHTQVFADLLECYSVLDDGLAKYELEKVLPKMAQFLADMVHPDGMISLFSDGGLNMTYSPAECLSMFERVFRTKVCQANFIAYPEAGYFGLRHEDSLILMDAAELAPRYLPGHGHGDALSFEWSVAGQRVITDPGVFEYNPGELRDFARSTRNHNTVTLDGQDQTEFWQAFRVGRRASITTCEVDGSPESATVFAAHDGYRRLRGRPIHTRHLTMTPHQITIKDSILYGSGQRAIARLILDPQIEVNKRGRDWTLRGAQLAITVECDHPIAVEETICFFDFGHKRKTKQLVIDFGCAPCSCETILTVVPVAF